MCVHKGPTQTQDNTANEVVRKLREALQRFLDELDVIAPHNTPRKPVHRFIVFPYLQFTRRN